MVLADVLVVKAMHGNPSIVRAFDRRECIIPVMSARLFLALTFATAVVWIGSAPQETAGPPAGRGNFANQEKGAAIADFGEGQPVYLRAGLPHWPGAAPDQSVDQMSVNAGDLKWGDKVTDEEYLGRKR